MRKLLPTLTFIDICLEGFLYIGSSFLLIYALRTLDHRGGIAAKDVKFNVIQAEIPYIPNETVNHVNDFYEEHKRKLAEKAIKSTIEIKRKIKRKVIPYNEIVIEPDKIIPQPPIIETLEVKHNIIFKKTY